MSPTKYIQAEIIKSRIKTDECFKNNNKFNGLNIKSHGSSLRKKTELNDNIKGIKKKILSSNKIYLKSY
jgi:hypothetical protein